MVCEIDPWESLIKYTIEVGTSGSTCTTHLNSLGIRLGNDGNPSCVKPSTEEGDRGYFGSAGWKNNDKPDDNGVYVNSSDSKKSHYIAYKFTSTDAKAVRLSLELEVKSDSFDDHALNYQCALYKGDTFLSLSPDTITLSKDTPRVPFSCSFDVSAMTADNMTDAEIRLIGFNQTGAKQTRFRNAKIEVQK